MDGTLFDERGEGNELEATMEEGTHRDLALSVMVSSIKHLRCGA